MIKRIICLTFLIAIALIFPQKVHAEEIDTVIGVQLDKLGLEEVDGAAGDIFEESGFSLSETVRGIAANGWQISLSDILSALVQNIFSEIFLQISLMRRILFIAILCGFLKSLEDSFGGKAASELGFYICYILLIYIVMTSFYDSAQMVINTADELIVLLKAMLPTFITLLTLSGGAVQGGVMGPFIMGSAGIISYAIRIIIVPAIGLTAMLKIANNISDKGILSNLSGLMEKIISICLKGCAFGFMAVCTLQRTGASGINGVIAKTAKSAVGAVPVVGDVMEGAIDTAANLTGLLRGSLGIGTAILIVTVVLTPVIKLGVIWLIYKFAAAVIEPVSEPRLIKALSAAGDFSALLIGALFVVAVMFIFSAIILLTAV
ncbi:stage III sporulation protein AE [Anaerotignum faecicola]|nr:stage III sporulation protein AE [Anaerotignum faecicola]